MRAMLWAGPGVLVLGMVSLCAPMLRDERNLVTGGIRSAGHGARNSEMVPQFAGGAMVLAGAGLLFAGKKRV